MSIEAFWRAATKTFPLIAHQFSNHTAGVYFKIGLLKPRWRLADPGRRAGGYGAVGPVSSLIQSETSSDVG